MKTRLIAFINRGKWDTVLASLQVRLTAVSLVLACWIGTGLMLLSQTVDEPQFADSTQGNLKSAASYDSNYDVMGGQTDIEQTVTLQLLEDAPNRIKSTPSQAIGIEYLVAGLQNIELLANTAPENRLSLQRRQREDQHALLRQRIAEQKVEYYKELKSYLDELSRLESLPPQQFSDSEVLEIRRGQNVEQAERDIRIGLMEAEARTMIKSNVTGAVSSHIEDVIP